MRELEDPTLEVPCILIKNNTLLSYFALSYLIVVITYLGRSQCLGPADGPHGPSS